MLLVYLISTHPFMCNFDKFMGVQGKKNSKVSPDSPGMNIYPST